MKLGVLTAAFCVLLLPPAWAAESAEPGSGAQLILSQGSPWRCYYSFKTPVVRSGSDLAETSRPKQADVCRSPLPPKHWMVPDFDDVSWARVRFDEPATWKDYGFGLGRPSLRLQCLRGKFTVKDPARAGKLMLALRYRGGVVVYVNGKEIARADMPQGAIGFDTLANDYPPEAFDRPDGKPIRVAFRDPERFAERVKLRIRRLSIAVPSSLLRKGTNVLAVEIHRAPYFGKGVEIDNLNYRCHWATCGLVSLELRASGEGGVSPNLARPKGLQVWNCDVNAPLSDSDYADPHEASRPIYIVGARNGTFTGQVVVSRDQPLEGLKASASKLKHSTGNFHIPRSTIEVLYGVPAGKWERHDRFYNARDVLSEVAPREVLPLDEAKGVAQPLWLKVRVPEDAPPGDYRGKLAIHVGGFKLVEVAVHLRVVGWKVPDRRQFRTHVGLIQSPDSVALYYNVPLWSERHWKFLEKSFALLGEVGNKTVHIPLICRTNFGNEETMVRWVKQSDGTYSYDFTVFDRYMDLAQKYLAPDVVCLYVWDIYTGRQRWNRPEWKEEGTGVKVTLLDPATGRREEMEGAKYNSPEALAFWKPVVLELRERLQKRGLAPAMMIGIMGDFNIPWPETVEVFKRIDPDLKWVWNAHSTNLRAHIGYCTRVYANKPPLPGGKRSYFWQRSGGPVVAFFPRFRAMDICPLRPSAPLGVYQLDNEAAQMWGVDGIGRLGADFWGVMRSRRLNRTVIARFPESDWSQLNPTTSDTSLLEPGPDGALSSARFEMFREGVQQCEARMVLEKALLVPEERRRLSAELARRCREILEERAEMLRAAISTDDESWIWYPASGWELRVEKLFQAASEIQRTLAAKGGN